MKISPTHEVVMNGFKMPVYYVVAIQKRMDEVACMIGGKCIITFSNDSPADIIIESPTQKILTHPGEWIIISPTNSLIVANEKQYRTIFEIQNA